MKSFREFAPGDRYQYDFGLCSTKSGFAQVDTGSDAHYFGIWANPEKLVIFSYVEGDCETTLCDTEKEFCSEMLRIKDFYKGDFYGIDPGFDKTLKERFIKIGLGELLH